MAAMTDAYKHPGISPATGHYLAGLVDGEGCFTMARRNVNSYFCAFIIHLRADERPLLEQLRRETGLGKLYVGRAEKVGGQYPSVRWDVSRRSECLEIVRLFEAYPLRSRKAAVFELWARAVRAWGVRDWETMAAVHAGMRAARVFESEGVAWVAEPSAQMELCSVAEHDLQVGAPLL